MVFLINYRVVQSFPSTKSGMKEIGSAEKCLLAHSAVTRFEKIVQK